MTHKDLMNTADDALTGHDVFVGLLEPAEKQYLMDRGVVRSVSAGQIICRQHERASTLFIILLGEVEVSEGEKKKSINIARLGRGDVFGEVSALFRMARVSTVKAVKPTVLLELDGDVFEELIENNKQLLKAMIQRFGERIRETALRTVSFLRYLPVETFEHLKQETSLVSLLPGKIIVKEGEPGDAMYILIHGAARVSHQIDGQQLNLALLGPGDYFGEWSVLTGAPRTATVTTLSQVQAIRIDREQLLNFIQKHPNVRDRIDQIAHNRLEANKGSEFIEDAEFNANQSIQDIQDVLGEEKV
ncbi:MAG: cyclic nucleotide-binding domain-containing protein [Gammaproteobacteria bacterium]|nr:cyclic nucleotide-binding domain-containing protein [Gammaproteobacteria bacterium]MDH5777379.1 cyclic nucleotide-binding domain-containing protein [Gammaproteobacteria bacterium]